MSIALVRPFFRTRLNGLGFTEHTDAFDDENRPQTKLEKLYRIESGTIAGTPPESATHEFDVEVILVITLRGKGIKNIELVDRAWVVASDIYADILTPENRNGTDIKDITPDTATVSEFTTSDENDVILNMGFTCKILCEF